MRTNISLINRISEVITNFPRCELVYLKTDKNDQTDVTFMTTGISDELVLYLKNRLHPYQMMVTTKEWPTNDGTSVRIELFGVES